MNPGATLRSLDIRPFSRYFAKVFMKERSSKGLGSTLRKPPLTKVGTIQLHAGTGVGVVVVSGIAGKHER
jgi:hypothetical protein